MKNAWETNERIARVEPQDGIGKSYQQLVTMATEAYWVREINTDSNSFPRHWHILEVSQSGLVHYAQR